MVSTHTSASRSSVRKAQRDGASSTVCVRVDIRVPVAGAARAAAGAGERRLCVARAHSYVRVGRLSCGCL